MEDYQKYRWFYTSSGKLVVGGKSAGQNDDLISYLKKSNKDYLMMHTASPGSPFTCILSDISKISQSDKKECAEFTAAFSKAWRSKAKNVSIHIFLLSQLVKSRAMKSGTWGVKGKVTEMIVPEMKLVLIRQKEILRAVPSNLKNSNGAIFVRPGDIDKQDILAKLEIECNEPLSREEVLAALPAGGVSIKKKMINRQTETQLGKNGVTDNFIQTLSNAFKTHTSVRISVLKSLCRDKESIIKTADDLSSRLEGQYSYRILGFTIILRKISNKK